MEELIEVVTFPLRRYETTVKMCKTLATGYLATCLFIMVKGSYPMTYEYLTKTGRGFVDQKNF